MMKEEIANGIKEWNEKVGVMNVTIEFSFHRDNLKEFEQIVKNTEKPIGGKWKWFPCITCEQYYGEGYVHAEIIKD